MILLCFTLLAVYNLHVSSRVSMVLAQAKALLCAFAIKFLVKIYKLDHFAQVLSHFIPAVTIQAFRNFTKKQTYPKVRAFVTLCSESRFDCAKNAICSQKVWLIVCFKTASIIGFRIQFCHPNEVLLNETSLSFA